MTGDLTLPRRRLLAAAAGFTLAGPALAAPRRGTLRREPVNPLVRQRADALIFRHGDGRYYMTASVPEYDRLIIRRADTLAGLSDAPETVIWRRPAAGKLGGYIWAPELHQIDGVWHMYFAAGDKDEPFHIRTYVLRCQGRDPLTGRWAMLGQLQTPWDTFTLDSTSFVHRGVRYLLWAQKEPGIDTNSNLYLAPLATPTTFARAPVRLTVPTLEWEIQGFKVNEGPAPLERNGRLWVSYSASATDARYCLGLIAADADADIMRAEAWWKSPEPVFVTSEATGVYGPGHNSFTVDEQGRDVLVYHGRHYREIKGDPLFDPNRHTRVQRLYYRRDGAPDFGVPVGDGPLPDRFAPLDGRGGYLHHAGDRVSVGEAPLPNSQFRRVPGLAGPGTVSFEPILARGSVLRRAPSGELRVESRRSGRAFAEQASFRRHPGLADPRAASFAAVDRPGEWLRHARGRAVVGPARTADQRAGATFKLS